MSGCYRCGLPDGSDSRLCETCFAFKLGQHGFIERHAESQAATGIELTPRMQRWILSGGFLAYIAVVGFGVIVQEERLQLRQGKPGQTSTHTELITVGGNEFPIKHQQQFGFLEGPAGELVSD